LGVEGYAPEVVFAGCYGRVGAAVVGGGGQKRGVARR
jgi:hypothetical protein